MRALEGRHHQRVGDAGERGDKYQHQHEVGGEVGALDDDDQLRHDLLPGKDFGSGELRGLR